MVPCKQSVKTVLVRKIVSAHKAGSNRMFDLKFQGVHLRKISSFLFSFATSLSRPKKTFLLLLIDVILVPLSFVLAHAVLYGSVVHPPITGLHIVALALFAAAVSAALGLPRLKLNAYEETGIRKSAWFAFWVGSGFYFSPLLTLSAPADLGLALVFAMAFLILSVTIRFWLRRVLVNIYLTGKTRKRILIYGAGQTGVQLANALRTDESVVPVAFVDDNKALHRVTIAGLPIYVSSQIEDLITERSIDRIVLAMPSISRPKQTNIARQLEKLGCEVSALPSFAALIGHEELINRIHPVNASDFLGRRGLNCDDLAEQCSIYDDKSVMITGAGGSIGSELSRQILNCAPSKIVLFELSEHALYQIEQELLELVPTKSKIEIVPVLGSVTDKTAVERTIADHKIHVVLHAAAYKHVPMVERNRVAGLRNNVLGTKVVADAAKDAGVRHFMLISTDKAVNPKNVMGASKRLAELYVQNLARQSGSTVFGIVRFGNVLGSSGSVVPLFEEQIARGGPVTLTHQDVTRYFMTLTEAARLVLLAGTFCGETGRTGEIFLLDMGAPVPIRNLARQMIEAAGYTVCDAENPTGDIEITITGLRPGEKLHEELAVSYHQKTSTRHEKINRVEEPALSEIEIATAISRLNKAIDDDDSALATKIVFDWTTRSRDENSVVRQRSFSKSSLKDMAAEAG